MSASKIDELRAKAFRADQPIVLENTASLVLFADAEAALAECGREKTDLERRLVELKRRLRAALDPTWSRESK